MTNQELEANALEALRASARQRLDERRSYEWQVSLALWTALAVLPGALIAYRGQLPLARGQLAVSILAFGALASSLHWCWLASLWAAHDRDTRRAIELEGGIVKLLKLDELGVSSPEPWKPDWRRIAMPGFTVLLSFAAFLAVLILT